FRNGPNRTPLRRILGRVVEDHPHRPLTQLWRVLASSSHGLHPPSEWALRQSRYDSQRSPSCFATETQRHREKDWRIALDAGGLRSRPRTQASNAVIKRPLAPHVA